MTVALRPYQERDIGRLREALRAGHRSVCYVLPTGGGKTLTMAWMARSAAAKRRHTWFLVHRQELMRQASRTFDMIGVEHGLIYKHHTMTRERVQIASVQTLARRLARTPTKPDLIVVDEAHHCSATTYRRILAAYPDAVVIGLTATPARTDGQGLDDIFSELVVGPSMAALIEEGFLSRYRIYAPPIGISTEGVRTRAGDFAKDQLAEAVDKPTITGDAVKHYLRLAAGRRAIAFCASIEHSKHVAASFRAAGVAAEHFDGETEDRRRERIVERFASGEIEVLCNVDLVGEGFDVPACEVAILLRPTQSVILFLQQVGRALRPAPGKDRALILDHAGNALRHGLPDEEREWTLAGRKRRGRKQDVPPPPVKQCPDCFACHAPAPACPACGHVYESTGRAIEQQEGELEAVDPEALKRARRVAQAKASTLEDLVELGRARGYKNPAAWARHVWAARQRKQRRAA